MPADTLSSYPYVTVKLACRRSSRNGSYKLARLADKYGAEVRMTDLLGFLAGDCKLWEPRHPAMERCGAYFADLDAPPPDLPTEGQRRMRVVAGGKKWRWPASEPFLLNRITRASSRYRKEPLC